LSELRIKLLIDMRWLGTAPLLCELDASFCDNPCNDTGSLCYCNVDTTHQKCLCPTGYHRPTTDATASCQRKWPKSEHV